MTERAKRDWVLWLEKVSHLVSVDTGKDLDNLIYSADIYTLWLDDSSPEVAAKAVLADCVING